MLGFFSPNQISPILSSKHSNISKKAKNLIFLENSFTLVELLVVVALLAILATVVILVLNPSELLRQARDSRRLNDLSILNRAINMYIADTGGGGFYGSSSVVYVSIPDSSPTCSNLGLPSLPSGWSYHCAPSSTLQNIDGSGWIPINFNLQTFGRSITRLPIDPINQTSTLNYYTYVTGGSFKLTSRFESEKYVLSYTAKDEGPDPALYETGSDPQLAPFVGGLVGWWPFDEGSGTVVYDRSGYGNHGTMYSSSTITDLHTSVGCKSGSCASFDGVDDYVKSFTNGFSFEDNSRSIIVWINNKGTPSGFGQIIHYGNNDCTGKMFGLGIYSNNLEFWGGCKDWYTGLSVSLNEWLFIGLSYDKNKLNIWMGGQKKTQALFGFTTQNSNLFIGAETINNGLSFRKYFNGLIDEVRIYNRALSDAEIKAIYEATK